jgi:hypothetical protein
MLASALVRLLEGMGMQVVLDLTALEEGPAVHYDAAITTGGIPNGIESDLVIELAGSKTADAVDWVRRGDGYLVRVDDLQAVLDLLKAFYAAGARRLS